MRKVFLALPLLFSSPALAGDVDPARAALLMPLIRDHGGMMTDRQAGEILPEHGFEKYETRDIGRLWKDEGKFDTAGALALKLSDETCSSG